MYICVIVSTIDVNDCIFCVNEQQKVYLHRYYVFCYFTPFCVRRDVTSHLICINQNLE